MIDPNFVHPVIRPWPITSDRNGPVSGNVTQPDYAMEINAAMAASGYRQGWESAAASAGFAAGPNYLSPDLHSVGPPLTDTTALVPTSLVAHTVNAAAASANSPSWLAAGNNKWYAIGVAALVGILFFGKRGKA